MEENEGRKSLNKRGWFLAPLKGDSLHACKYQWPLDSFAACTLPGISPSENSRFSETQRSLQDSCCRPSQRKMPRWTDFSLSRETAAQKIIFNRAHLLKSAKAVRARISALECSYVLRENMQGSQGEVSLLFL